VAAALSFTLRVPKREAYLELRLRTPQRQVTLRLTRVRNETNLRAFALGVTAAQRRALRAFFEPRLAALIDEAQRLEAATRGLNPNANWSELFHLHLLVPNARLEANWRVQTKRGIDLAYATVEPGMSAPVVFWNTNQHAPSATNYRTTRGFEEALERWERHYGQTGLATLAEQLREPLFAARGHLLVILPPEHRFVLPD
jgi:hypothetical protein